MVIITAFTSIGRPANASDEILRSLRNAPPPSLMRYNGAIKLLLLAPLSRDIGEAAEMIVTRSQAQFCLLTGQARHRTALGFERFATNLMDFRKPDGAGRLVRGTEIVRNGPIGYRSTVPESRLKRLTSVLHASGIPAFLSNKCGNHLCNQLYYTVLHQVALHDADMEVVFLHLLPLPRRVAAQEPDAPSMSLDLQRGAIAVIVNEVMMDSRALRPGVSRHDFGGAA